MAKLKIGIGTYSFGGPAGFLGLGPKLREKLVIARGLGYELAELLTMEIKHDAEDIKKWMAETGMEVISVHAEPTEETIKKMAAIGGKAVVCAGTPFNSRKEAIEVAGWLDGMAEIAEPYGIKIGYHNHSQEFYFDEGKSLLEHLLDNSRKCYVQLDCGWAMNGGMYSPYFIRKYRNRILSIHVKENSKVHGPGKRPASRYDERPSMAAAFGNVMEKSVEERQKILEQMLERFKASAGSQTANQCRMGAPESNMDWPEIKKALDEQDFEADWIVEREDFYDEHDKCLADDCEWLKANIV